MTEQSKASARKDGRGARASLSIAVVAGIGLATATTGSAIAQAPRRAAPATLSPAVPAGKGLNAIPPQEVLAELSARRLETLQKKAYDLYNVPESERAGMSALNALALLTDKTKKLTPNERQKLIAQGVSGLNVILPTLKSPTQLMNYSALLIDEGAKREVNTMEYWGESAASQARLRPMAAAIDDLLGRAVDAAQVEMDAVVKQLGINPNNGALADKWEELENLQILAKFTRGMSSYYRVISIPNADAGKAERAKVADEGITILKEFDNADSPETSVQPVAKNRIGKLNLAKGDAEAAKQFFTAVADGETTPKGDVNMVYEAKYFSAVADLMRGNMAGAKKDLATLEDWQKQSFTEPAALKGVEAAADMLRYRIFSTEARMAAAGPAKQKAEDDAINVLMQLNEKRPELRGIIFGQLIERIGKDKPVAQMDPLLLEAMVQKGVEDFESKEPKAQQTFARAVEAGQELAKRAAAGQNVPPKLAESSAFLVPYFLEKTGKKVEAVNAFLDAIQKYPQNPEVKNALDNAGRIVFNDVRNEKANPEGWNSAPVLQTYDRFLPVAIGKPFNRTELAWEHARRLRETRQFKKAAENFALVPEKDPRYVAAQYLRMISLTSLLDQDGPDKKPLVPPGEERKALTADIVATAQKVRAMALAAAQAATEPAKKQFELTRVAGCTLTAAQISASELKDAKQTLEILKDFEQEVQGLPATTTEPMLGNVLQLRVGSYLEAGQFQKAVDTLLELLKKEGGEKGQVFVRTVLEKLDQDFRKAAVAGDKARMSPLAINRAKLSKYLVDWAKKNDAKHVYGYSVFDAEATLAAAELSADKAQLAEARKAFENLLGPDMTKLYQQEHDGEPKFDKDFPHPNVLLGLGKAAFAEGDFETSTASFGRLLNAKKLGTAKIQKADPLNPAEPMYVDNEPYWEAWYKFLRGTFALYDANKQDKKLAERYDDAKGALKRLYIIQNPPGGEKWSDEFEEMRKAYIPDFDPKTLVPAASQPAETEPATAPAAPVAAGK